MVHFGMGEYSREVEYKIASWWDSRSAGDKLTLTSQINFSQDALTMIGNMTDSYYKFSHDDRMKIRHYYLFYSGELQW